MGCTHRKVTYLQLGSPAICMRVAVCLHVQTNSLIYLSPTPTSSSNTKYHIINIFNGLMLHPVAVAVPLKVRVRRALDRGIATTLLSAGD